MIVEDDQNLRDSLASTLLRAELSCEAVGDPRDAVKMLGAQPFDAILLDVGLPSIDGLALLSHLRQRRVAVPVLVMSGFGGSTRKDRAAELGASFLRKPFSAVDVVAALRSLLGEDTSEPDVAPANDVSGPCDAAPPTLRTRLRECILRSCNGDPSGVPVVDARLTQAIDLLEAESVSASCVAALIAGDAGVVAGVLGLANSSLHPAAQTVTELDRAVARVGHRAVLEIVVQSLTRAAFGTEIEPFKSMITARWRRSAATAALAGYEAVERGMSPGVAYCAALLQDVGELAALVLIAEMLAEEEVTEGPSLACIEQEVSRWHARLGSAILRAWGVPAPIPQVAENHHAAGARADPLVALIASCDRIVGAVLADQPFESSSPGGNDHEKELYGRAQAVLATLTD